VSPRIGRGTGFAKWPALVDHTPAERAAGLTHKRPRRIPGRKYQNKRGQWGVNGTP